MLVLRKIRLLWLLVMIVVTPVIALPWNTISKSIAQQQEDDDAGADDGEMIAVSASWLQQGRAPNPPPPRPLAELPVLQRFAVRQDSPPPAGGRISAPQSTRVRLQI